MDTHDRRRQRHPSNPAEALPEQDEASYLPAAPNQRPREKRRGRTKRPASRIRVATPGVAPLSPDDHAQAVTALATLIAHWWREHGTPPVQQPSGDNRPQPQQQAVDDRELPPDGEEQHHAQP